MLCAQSQIPKSRRWKNNTCFPELQAPECELKCVSVCCQSDEVVCVSLDVCVGRRVLDSALASWGHIPELI